MEVRQREDRFDLPDLLLLDDVPEVVAQEQQAAFGVVDDVDDVVGREILEDRHDDGSVGDRADVGDAPAGIVAPDERDLVALPDAGLAVEEVQAGYLLGHFVVGEGLAVEIVGQGRHLAVVAETGLVDFQ